MQLKKERMNILRRFYSVKQFRSDEGERYCNKCYNLCGIVKKDAEIDGCVWM